MAHPQANQPTATDPTEAPQDQGYPSTTEGRSTMPPDVRDKLGRDWQATVEECLTRIATAIAAYRECQKQIMEAIEKGEGATARLEQAPTLLDAILAATKEHENTKEQAEEAQRTITRTLLRLQADIDAYADMEAKLMDGLSRSPMLCTEPGHEVTTEDIQAAKEAHLRLSEVRHRRAHAFTRKNGDPRQSGRPAAPPACARRG